MDSPPTDPWDSRVILGVAAKPTISDIEAAYFQLKSNLAQEHAEKQQNQSANGGADAEYAYQRRKVQDAYEYLRWQVRNEQEKYQYEGQQSCDTPAVQVQWKKETLTLPALDVSTSLGNQSTATLARASLLFDSDAATTNTQRRHSVTHDIKKRATHRRLKLRRVRTGTGSSSSVGSQVSDSSTTGTMETLGAIKDMLQVHIDAAKKSEGRNPYRGEKTVFQFFRRHQDSSKTASSGPNDDTSKLLAGLLLKFDELESGRAKWEFDECRNIELGYLLSLRLTFHDRLLSSELGCSLR